MNLVAGTLAAPASPDGEIEDRSPADLGDVLGRFPWALADVDRAVEAARVAQPRWAAKPLPERASALLRFRDVIASRKEAIARIIARDVGKPLWEARTEVDAVVAKFAATLDEGMKLVAPFDAPGQAGAECRFKPHGVLAVLGPFNFPMHLANGHVVPALACGNTVVLKPSEIAPAVALEYARAAVDAGLPPGVLNVVQGPGAVGARLAGHAGVDGVLLTGSWAVGQEVKRATFDSAKVLALELGGKNAALVAADADLDKAAHDVAFAAFVTAGQRCTATSRVLVEGAVAEEFTQRLVARARRIVVGHPFDEPAPFSGPLASAAALAKFSAGLDVARKTEGVSELVASRFVTAGARRGYYVTPSVHVAQRRPSETPYLGEELFGPDVAVTVVSDLDEAIALANDVPYGLAASVFTRSEATFERCYAGLEAGCINWNAPTVGSSSRLPFGGVKRSGNHRPAALWSALYCASPVAVMRGAPTMDGVTLLPGM